MHAHTLRARIIRQIVFGANDGSVTTLGIVSGLAGASLGNNMVLLVGLAATFAGALSMAVGEYLSTKSQISYYQGTFAREEKEISERPALEKERIRKIYKAKGFRNYDLERVVDIITRDKNVWLKVLMEEDFGLSKAHFERPVVNALIMGVSFVVASAIPLSPYIFIANGSALTSAVALSLVTFIGIGILKAPYTGKHFFISSFETLFWGTLISAVSYYLGEFFSLIAGYNIVI